MLPLLPRAALHFLNAFVVLAILLILFFPSQSRSEPIAGTQAALTTTTALAIPHHTHHISVPRPSSQWLSSTLTVLASIFSFISALLLAIGRLLWLLLRPLHLLADFALAKLLFLLHPFIILGTGVYTMFVRWPLQTVDYLTTTLYPLYVFLACAAIMGLLIGAVAGLTSTTLNNTLFPPRPLKPQIKKEEESVSRPKTADSGGESLVSSGTVTPFRLAPLSKWSSEEDAPLLDTTALFTSFSLPVLLTSGGNVAVGETIFEEEDDSDGTPVAESGPVKQEVSFEMGRTGTSRKGVESQGIYWRDESAVRQRNRGLVV
jgi:hypothetical protein